MNKKKRRITPAKPQAATQAITPSFRPRPSYPLWLRVKPVNLVYCNCETKRRNSLRSGAIFMKEF